MKIIDVVKKNLLGFVVGIVLTMSITTVALSIVASDVSYDNTNSGSEATTMQGAIDDLYDMAANMPKGIKVVTLGTATSYNIKNLYPDIDYTKLTTANFYYRIAGNSKTSAGGDRTCDRAYVQMTAPSISYNASTGVLTCGNGTAVGKMQYGSTAYETATVTLTTTCYMVYAE